MNLPDEMVEAIKCLADGTPDIVAVHLFGSGARGEHRADSDVDLALQPSGTTDGERLAAYIGMDKRPWSSLGERFALPVDIDYYEPHSDGIVAPAVEAHGLELYRRPE